MGEGGCQISQYKRDWRTKAQREKRQRRKRQLGMSSGKARHILVQSLLRMLMELCFDSTCYRCGKKIKKNEDFHIDHMEPWENSRNPKKLFFDLNNISFSHAHCNIMAKFKKN